MKIQSRFIQHILLGFFILIILFGITVLVVMDGILPRLGMDNEQYEWIVVIIFAVDTFACIIWFGWYFGSPLLLIMKWINQLANEDSSPLKERERIYTRKGKLKMRFRLYQEVIVQLDQMRTQLEQARNERAQVEQAKQEWIAGISHDLKTPLTYIKGYSTLLLNAEYDRSKEEQMNFIREIEDKGTHMEQLVQDLSLAMRFDSSQSLPLRKTAQQLVAFVQQVLADISNDMRAQKHHFELHGADYDIVAEFDPYLLKRALQNIYMNAIIHNEAPIKIDTYVDVEPGAVMITIQDNGIGMSEETRQQVFNRYYRGTTTEQQSDGTGLGMAIVKSLIEAHEGTIAVESKLQQGTTFTIALPHSLYRI